MAVDSSVLERRRAGVLLHITSLPGDGDNGDLGEHAFHFVDFLAQNALSVWQTLPVNPTGGDGSPYQCLSAHAGNPLLISLEWLAERGLLAPERIPGAKAAAAGRLAALAEAHAVFRQDDRGLAEDYRHFIQFHHYWLEDFALFMALKERFGQRAWWEWPPPYRDRDPDALDRAREELAHALDRVRFEQFVFFHQWQALRHHAHRHGVLLFGDMPIFVAADSADVWARRRYFQLDDSGHPKVVAGVPPDYFSTTGQRWGNPHYDWEALQRDGFSWWIERMHTQLELFDWIRIDHFRGFQAYWEIPAEAETAAEGRWVEAPGEALLEAIFDRFGALPLVAEDLGIITPEVEDLRRKFAIPGMLVLQFAFDGGPDNPYLPHNHSADRVVYTGTHDNDTTLSWFESLADEQKGHVYDYLGHPQEAMPWALMRCAFASVATVAIVPMQDVLGLGQGHRMNTPGTTEGNWHWRFAWEQLQPGHGDRLRHWSHLYGRSAG